MSEPFHGHAVRLFPGDPQTPFLGAFIDKGMRVRGRYPYETHFRQSCITDGETGVNSGDVSEHEGGKVGKSTWLKWH